MEPYVSINDQAKETQHSNAELKQKISEANHILVRQGVLDGFGHVSARSPLDHDRFLLSRNLAPALVTPDDIQELKLDATTEDSRPSYLERFIHAAIYRQRPDVQAVVHSHAPAVVPYSTVGKPLRPILHMAGFLPDPTPVFEIRDVSGDETDLLIRSNEQADHLASVLGIGSVALMRGHGSVAVGASVEEAVYNAIYTETNARGQALAEQLGDPIYLTAGERGTAEATMRSQLPRAWNFWLGQIVTKE